MGAYLQLVTPGIPLLGAWIYSGPVRDTRTTASPSPACSPTRRRRTLIAAPDGRRRRTCWSGRWTRSLTSSAWTSSSFDARTSSQEFPHTMASGLTIDSGDYDATLDRLLEMLDLEAIRTDQEQRRARGDAKQIGVGFSTYNEMCGLAPSRILGAIRYAVGGWDSATIRFQPLGSVQLVTGTSPHGQSHDTTFAQIVADQLGVDFADVEVLHGDTAVSQQGMDTYGSRSLAVGGIASGTRARRSSKKLARSSRTSSRWRKTTSSSRTARSASRARRTVRWHRRGRLPGARGPQPPRRHGAGTRGDSGL